MQFFQRTFAVTSITKLYTKVWELWVHPDYGDLYIPLTSRFQPQTNVFPVNNSPFSIKHTFVWVRISEKKNHQFFWFEILFKVGEIMVLKYGHLMLPGTFADKVTSDIDFTDKDVVQCDLLGVKILL